MRASARRRSKKGNGGAPSRSSKSVSNQLAFNVICLALAVGGDSHTEPCESEYND